MAGVTDLNLIEPVMRDWERQREIELWREWFRKFDGHASASEPGILELRLAVFTEEARLHPPLFIATKNVRPFP